jgi:hypothetical protein
VRHAEPVVSEGSKMSRPNDEGHRANDAPQDQNQIQHCDFAADAGEREVLVFSAMQARATRSGCTLREVGDLLRRIGGRR